jgi:hypothetical protein
MAAKDRFGKAGNSGRATQHSQDLQQELGDAADALRRATNSLGEPPKPTSKATPPVRRGLGIGRMLLLLAVGSVGAMVLSEGLRTKLLDLLFGAEEEFDYSSTTTPETPAPAAVPS